MKKIIVSLVIGLLLIATPMPAFAGGDQMRGENGQGTVTQVQVQNRPPFQP